MRWGFLFYTFHARWFISRNVIATVIIDIRCTAMQRP
jgi:hypothetical protein